MPRGDRALPIRLRAAIGLLLCAAVVGCSSQSSIERFIPTDDVSRAAITQAFEAWRQGTAAGPVPDTAPVVHVTDNYRRPGETLSSFRILGEVPGDTPRCYAVELEFSPPRQERARYVVVGIDPLWVFRMEDYQLLAHWEHKMDPPKTSAAEQRP